MGSGQDTVAAHVPHVPGIISIRQNALTAAYQDAQTNGIHDQPESEVEESAKENDGASVRTMSITNSIRFSRRLSSLADCCVV